MHTRPALHTCIIMQRIRRYLYIISLLLYMYCHVIYHGVLKDLKH